MDGNTALQAKQVWGESMANTRWVLGCGGRKKVCGPKTSWAAMRFKARVVQPNVQYLSGAAVGPRIPSFSL